MSSVVMPALAAAITAAPLVEGALNTLISMPAFSIVDLSRLATVDSATGLCGLTIPKNNLVCASVSLRCLVLSSYSLSVATGHRHWL